MKFKKPDWVERLVQAQEARDEARAAKEKIDLQKVADEIDAINKIGKEAEKERQLFDRMRARDIQGANVPAPPPNHFKIHQRQHAEALMEVERRRQVNEERRRRHELALDMARQGGFFGDDHIFDAHAPRAGGYMIDVHHGNLKLKVRTEDMDEFMLFVKDWKKNYG